ncbi:SDR family NAD(P)-dependent oxidoreductase [uncultured Methylobacterium sp.]|uniref:SDR family NAD(P)-dependent oxidoreductase n=1 Tax=uncultured Methylobacterium sp. TaxID=157278 RepID=UPI002591B45A|nr:SDR family NAD(P)-dependent oxidoreductase [uncultured Methylobacterium sp.]
MGRDTALETQASGLPHSCPEKPPASAGGVVTSPTSSTVWFITGCSTGFGHELAKLVLARGWRAVVTARDADRVSDLVSGTDERGLALPLDVTDTGQIAAAIAAARERFGRIDVLVNNAGYGYQASVEEGEEPKIRAQFDANVFGPFRTDWAGRSLVQTPNTISDYAETVGARLRATTEKSGTQAGDPVRAGEAMIRLAESADPPRHLVLGSWGFETVTERLRARLAEIESWRETSVATDYPEARPEQQPSSATGS